MSLRSFNVSLNAYASSQQDEIVQAANNRLGNLGNNLSILNHSPITTTDTMLLYRMARSFADALFEYLFLSDELTNTSQQSDELPEDYYRALPKLTQHNQLVSELSQLLLTVMSKTHSSMEISSIRDQFFSTLSIIRSQLLEDARFFQKSDPAATSLAEIVLAYPGFYAIAIYRIAHTLYQLKVPLLPRLVSEWAHSKTGIDIHPGAQIACPFFIDHGTGVVIGQTTVIGQRVILYQGVTLGALALHDDDLPQKRHPTLEDDVIVYAGSCILGGDTTIGHHSIIGGNVWLTRSVPPFSMAYHLSEVRIRERSQVNENDFLNFII